MGEERKGLGKGDWGEIRETCGCCAQDPTKGNIGINRDRNNSGKFLVTTNFFFYHHLHFFVTVTTYVIAFFLFIFYIYLFHFIHFYYFFFVLPLTNMTSWISLRCVSPSSLQRKGR